jgi:hypothetical protein
MSAGFGNQSSVSDPFAAANTIKSTSDPFANAIEHSSGSKTVEMGSWEKELSADPFAPVNSGQPPKSTFQPS